MHLSALTIFTLTWVLYVEAQWDSGAGCVYTLRVTQDVSIEGSWNHNNLRYLMVGQHAQYPIKRSLLQFEDLNPNCTNIKWAKMYLYFVYAHKASWQSVNQSPYISRPLQLYQVRQMWLESQATKINRVTGKSWSQPLLALDGTDAGPNAILCEPVNHCTSRPSGFMEFDITRAMRNWKAGDPNYGLLLLATNEDTVGRDIRFSSNAERTTSRHAYVNVLCDCND